MTEEEGRLRELLAKIEMELKHPQMDGSHVVRALALAKRRWAESDSELPKARMSPE